MNLEKYAFHYEKCNFEPTGNTACTTQVLAFRKALKMIHFLENKSPGTEYYHRNEQEEN